MGYGRQAYIWSLLSLSVEYHTYVGTLRVYYYKPQTGRALLPRT